MQCVKKTEPRASIEVDGVAYTAGSALPWTTPPFGPRESFRQGSSLVACGTGRTASQRRNLRASGTQPRPGLVLKYDTIKPDPATAEKVLDAWRARDWTD